jgi:hypothetical protein
MSQTADVEKKKFSRPFSFSRSGDVPNPERGL